MKLDAKAIRYLTSEDFRVLAAVSISPSAPAMLTNVGSSPLTVQKLTKSAFTRWKPEAETMR